MHGRFIESVSCYGFTLVSEVESLKEASWSPPLAGGKGGFLFVTLVYSTPLYTGALNSLQSFSLFTGVAMLGWSRSW